MIAPLAIFANRSSRQRRARCGFTLVEVLAALMLMAIALPVIMRGIALCSSSASTAKRRTEAGALAESKLNELIATGYWQTAALQGDFVADGWPDYQWSGELQSWGQGQGATASNVVQELDLHVTWLARGQQQSITVSSLVYQSANSTSGSGTGSGTSSSAGATK